MNIEKSALSKFSQVLDRTDKEQPLTTSVLVTKQAKDP